MVKRRRKASPKRRSVRRTRTVRAAPIRRRAKRRTLGGVLSYVKPFGVGMASGYVDSMAINPIINKLSFAQVIPLNLAQAGLALAAKKFLKFNPMGLTEEYIKGKMFMAGTAGVSNLVAPSNSGAW